MLSLHSRPPISELFISNNPGLLFNSDNPNNLLDNMFRGIMAVGRLLNLNLSGCGIAATLWSRYLPFMRSLQRLNLSQNSINDDGLVMLCFNVEHCTSLLELDISYNKFLGHGGHALTRILRHNGYLQLLSMRGNRLQTKSVWTSVAQSLEQNTTLLSLELNNCDINIADAEILCSAFRRNSTVTINLSENSLPSKLIQEPRLFIFPVYGSGVKQQEHLPLSAGYQYNSLINSHAWCTQKRIEIMDTLEASGIVADPANGEIDGGNIVNRDAAFLSENDFRHYLYSPSIVEKSFFYLSPEKLAALVSDFRQMYSMDTKQILVSFGRLGFNIGSIDINGGTTYGDVDLLVKPLVRAFTTTLPEEEQKDFLSYQVLTVSGESILQNEELRLKLVWPDIRHQDQPNIILRPASWLKIM